MQKVIRRRSLNGFTLVELVIVMLILVALAGIMVPLFGGFTDRAHNSAASANISEIAKQLELFSAKTQKGYPDNWDNLALNASTVWTPTGASVTVGISPNAAILMSPAPLGTDEVQSLINAGITHITDANANKTDNATFHAFNLSTDLIDLTTTAAPYAITLNMAALQSAGVGLQNADTSKFTYVLLGLGQSCTAVGQVMVSAPVHYDTIDPAVFYQRYGAIFAVPIQGSPNRQAPARLVGVVGIHDGGFAGLDQHIGDYNKDVNSGN